MIRKMRPAVSLRGRDGGRMMPSCAGGGGGASEVVDAAAVHQRQRRDVLLDAVLEDLEVVLRQVGDELILVVAHDGVHRDEVDRDAEGRLPCPGAARAAGGAGAWAGAGRRPPPARSDCRPRRVRCASYRQYKTSRTAASGRIDGLGHADSTRQAPSRRPACDSIDAMRIAIGADHAGFEMKRDLAGYLAQQGHEVIDLGTHSTRAGGLPRHRRGGRHGRPQRSGRPRHHRVRQRRRRGGRRLQVPGRSRRGLPRRLHRAAGGRARRRQRAVPGLARDWPGAGAHARRSVPRRRRSAAEERHMRRLAKIDAIEIAVRPRMTIQPLTPMTSTVGRAAAILAAPRDRHRAPVLRPRSRRPRCRASRPGSGRSASGARGVHRRLRHRPRDLRARLPADVAAGALFGFVRA